MNVEWVFSARDVDVVIGLVGAQESDAFFLFRKKRNVDRDRPAPSKERFWMAMVGCLLTTRQRAGPGYPVNRFLNLDPFPLRYEECVRQDNLESYVQNTISTFGGIRMAPTIAKHANTNLGRLERGSFEYLIAMLLDLEGKRDKRAERTIARTIDIELIGFGPKQSRNLIQWIGSSVYEIPLDSRIIRWITEKLSLKFLEANRLSDLSYYEKVLDSVQELCASANVLPCLFDAAVFSSFDDGEWTDEALRSSMLFGA